MLNNSVGELGQELRKENEELTKKHHEEEELAANDKKLTDEIRELTGKIDANKRKIVDDARVKAKLDGEIRLLERQLAEKHQALAELTRINAEELRKSGMKLK